MGIGSNDVQIYKGENIHNRTIRCFDGKSKESYDALKNKRVFKRVLWMKNNLWAIYTKLISANWFDDLKKNRVNNPSIDVSDNSCKIRCEVREQPSESTIKPICLYIKSIDIEGATAF